ncbi:murein biosynthesis integral membrane protein MurJ [Epidermidibacterium keratini]|uniref:Murein biosynthesis integral membrane protein MurJ n=1 Tax=Epidermidibacterium keratini TaxID=1891644 RepID=A0A7L4YMW5_9ACTN|nr:murein biosynthesis integral membrane protein MurJ [Epidermidibacterium keratini]QHC00490.1 murein biosynthesis integral membrane protein MurJ [Epidermidibacterium keratini]
MSQGGLLRSAGQVAIGTLMSRITGFARTLALAALLGSTLVNDAYNVANTLPNMVFELLLGGVLTSVIVPLLVRAEKDAEERGGDPNAYPQRLFTLAVTGLTIATVLGIATSGLLVTAMNIGPDKPHHDTATLMTMLLLPQMIFYGIGALAGAVLNTRESYQAPAWAPVLNNVVVIVVAGAMIAMRKSGSTFSTTDVVILCIGTTLGIVVQALVLIPSWRKVGFRWKWRFDVRGVGLGELKSLAGWVIGYVLIGQVGYIVAARVANAASDYHAGQLTQWAYASLLFQLPYGILGVSLLTALMPKMSRAARDGDWPGVKRFLADGTRLTGLGMIPVTVAFWLLAVPLTVLFFDAGNFSGLAARQTGLILAASSFGLLPYAVSLLQLRVFFATKDAKTPALIMVGIVLVRIVLSIASFALPTTQIVLGLAIANSVAFTVGAVVGEIVLRRRLGSLGTRAVVGDLLRMLAAALAGLLLMLPVYLGLQSLFVGGAAWSQDGLTGFTLLELAKWQIALILAVCSGVGLVGFVGAGSLLGIGEIRSLLAAVRRRLPGGRSGPPPGGPTGSTPTSPVGPDNAGGGVRLGGSGVFGDDAPTVTLPRVTDGPYPDASSAPLAPVGAAGTLAANGGGQFGAATLDLDAPVPIPPGGKGARHQLPADPDRTDETINTDRRNAGPTDPDPYDPDRTVLEPREDNGDAPDWYSDQQPSALAYDEDGNPDPTSGEDDVAKKRSTKTRSKWALLGITAAGLALALVVGWFTGILAGKVFGPEEQSRASSSTTSSAPATATGSGANPGEALQIAGAELFDPPPGDGQENPDRINLSYDGQPGTAWPTLQYKGSANFGNIKPGVGIVYDLGADRTLSQVKIQTTIPGATVEIRVAASPAENLDGYSPVANATLQTTTDIAIAQGTTARYVLVWITSLVQQQGTFQASLSEVQFIS